MPAPQIRSVAVTAPSRLHFGMFSFGRTDVRQFGGVGAMIDSPGVRVSIRPADSLAVTGVHEERARQFVQQAVRTLRAEGRLRYQEGELPFALEVQHAPREHVGLGVGTQLGLSIAAALCAAFGLPQPSAVELARLAGRGARSAIGTHGFAHGGLLIEAGKHEPAEISPLVARIDLPAAWRFLLIMPKRASGMAGVDEQAAFSRLPAVPAAVTDSLVREAILNLLPAAATNDFREFGASLYRFGHLAGTCFAPAQGGPFSGEVTSKLVAQVKQLGIDGVGQSSWGPTIFALCENEAEAKDRLEQLRSILGPEDYDCLTSAPANHGAEIKCFDRR